MSEFFDYGTGVASGEDLFDTRKTGMSYYDQFLSDPEYMITHKNLEGKIIELSPKEYFEECAKIFNSTAAKQIAYTKHDEETIQHLKDVILVAKKKFPITFLNYASKSQEGRHRMYTAAELTSWDTKFPVLVIDWHDKERHEKQVEEERISDIKRGIKDAIRNTLVYRFDPEDPESLMDELQIQMNRAFGAGFLDPDIEFDVNQEGNEYTVSKDGVQVSFQSDDVKWEKVDSEELDIEIDDTEDDIDAFLAKYL